MSKCMEGAPVIGHGVSCVGMTSELCAYASTSAVRVVFAMR